jgi:3-oxoacyl-[acyl-carrier-protein] synthase III
MLKIKIAGTGWYLPERRVPNIYFEERYGIHASWIERATGVRERRYVDGETTVQMGTAAAQMALESANLRVEDLDAIVGASTGPEQTIPCTAALVQRALGAPEGKSACFDINATCLSFLFALQSVAHLVAAGVYRRVLIFSSEMASRALNPAERESFVLMGDAAAAVIVTKSEEGEASCYWHGQFATYSSGADLTRLLGGGTLHHPNDPMTTPEMNLFHMEGTAIFRQAVRLIGPFLETLLASLSWERQQIDVVVPHQASRHAIELLIARLGFTEQQVAWNLAERGNCIAASIPLTLAESVHSGRIKRGDRVLLLGSGAGLTLGAVALTY